MLLRGWCRSIYDFDVEKKFLKKAAIKIDKFFLKKNNR